MTDHGFPSPTTISDGDNENEIQHFRFFDLPRELRDWCYDYMIGPTFQPQRTFEAEENSGTYVNLDDWALHIAVKAPRLTSILCASREMKSEYQQRIIKQTTLEIYDHGELPTFPFDPTHYAISNFDWVVHADCSGTILNEFETDIDAGIAAVAVWIKIAVRKLQNLKRLGVFLALPDEAIDEYCKRPDYSHNAYIQTHLQAITKVDEVERLEVFRGGLPTLQAKEVPDEKLLFVGWTKTNGWVAPKSTDGGHGEAGLHVGTGGLFATDGEGLAE